MQVWGVPVSVVRSVRVIEVDVMSSDVDWNSGNGAGAVGIGVGGVEGTSYHPMNLQKWF